MELDRKALQKILLKNVKPQWKKMWKDEFNKSDILDFLVKKYSDYENTDKNIYPNKENILETFKYFDLKDIKLVFLGQDPYINSEIINDIDTPQATGLSFSVPNKVKIPPSLNNIFKELKNEIPEYEIPDNGNLIRWVKDENILLLNTALTVKKGKSNSHQKRWETITNNVIEYISNNTDNVIFLLLGNNAKSKAKFIDEDKHHIISGVHPSPLSASRGFFNSSIFIKVNNHLNNNNIDKIKW